MVHISSFEIWTQMLVRLLKNYTHFKSTAFYGSSSRHDAQFPAAGKNMYHFVHVISKICYCLHSNLPRFVSLPQQIGMSSHTAAHSRAPHRKSCLLNFFFMVQRNRKMDLALKSGINILILSTNSSWGNA